ncbi:MAG: tetratricopeptide repeat protein [Candidatus Omnitrophota bacterium]|nr:tetratricopeptide repeat protein [Candidatus Omnitrophota bacterium]MDZ4242016.1 tetratricopeptide repeat protein [Candidatus Omnitrophota bacterium]
MNKLVMVLIVMFVFSGCGGSQQSQQDKKNEAGMAEFQQLVTTGQATGSNAGQISAGLQSLREADVSSAIKNFDEAIKKNPRDPAGYLILGQTYLRLGDFNRASDTFEAGTRVAPSSGELFYLLAFSQGLAGDREAAQANAQRSVEIFQEDKDQEKFLRSVALLQGLMQVEGAPSSSDAAKTQ